MMISIICRALLPFIDSTKAFYRPRHVDMLKILADLKVNEKDLRLINNIYWKQNNAIKIDNEPSPYQPINKDV